MSDLEQLEVDTPDHGTELSYAHTLEEVDLDNALDFVKVLFEEDYIQEQMTLLGFSYNVFLKKLTIYTTRDKGDSK